LTELSAIVPLADLRAVFFTSQLLEPTSRRHGHPPVQMALVKMQSLAPSAQFVEIGLDGEVSWAERTNVLQAKTDLDALQEQLRKAPSTAAAADISYTVTLASKTSHMSGSGAF
jgi:hypothetical protein